MKQYQKDRLIKTLVWTIILTITIILWHTILQLIFPEM
jgi:hypothetical protein